MYLHLGQSVAVPHREILGIFDLDNASWAYKTREYLERAEQAGGHYRTERHGGVVVSSRSQRAGDYGGAAHAEGLRHRHDDERRGEGDKDGGDAERADAAPDKKGIDDIIEREHKHPRHRRDREL